MADCGDYYDCCKSFLSVRDDGSFDLGRSFGAATVDLSSLEIQIHSIKLCVRGSQSHLVSIVTYDFGGARIEHCSFQNCSD